MIEMKPYDAAFDDALIRFIAAFFAAHHTNLTPSACREILFDWASGADDDCRLSVIVQDGEAAGFVRTRRTSPTVCWIDDIFVDASRRGRGVATEAIRLTERALRADGVESVCMDVVPDNIPALRLYHRLGYDRLSMITVRKDFDAFDTERIETIAGFPLRVRRFD